MYRSHRSASRHLLLLGFAAAAASSCAPSDQSTDDVSVAQSPVLSGSQQIGVPAYFRDFAPIRITPTSRIIMNPSSGPGTDADKQHYTDQINAAHSAGIQVFGYIPTFGGGGDPNFDVGRAMNGVPGDPHQPGYKGLYPTIDGIFLDQVGTNYSYYSSAVSIIHSSMPAVQVAINPGTATTPAMRDLANFVVTAENYFYDQPSGPAYWGDTSFVDPNNQNRAWERDPQYSSKIWHIVHDADCFAMEKTIDLSRRRNATMAYATDGTKANSTEYNNPASYFAAEAAVVNGTNASIGSGSTVRAGFVFYNGSTNLDPTYSWNSMGGTNTISSIFPVSGAFRIDFPGLGDLGDGGIVHVTAVGSDNKTCSAGPPGRVPGTNTIEAVVACYNSSGQHDYASFTASYVRRTGATANGNGYAATTYQAGQLGCAAPNPGFGWNSSGVAPVLARASTGTYTTYFVSNYLFFAGAMAFVSAGDVGSGTHCSGSPGATGYRTNQDSFVTARCYNWQGNPIDQGVSTTIAYDNGVSPMGSPSFEWFTTQANGQSYSVSGWSGYVNGNRIANAPFIVMGGYGFFYVEMPTVTAGAQSNMQVAAISPSDSYCKIAAPWVPSNDFGGATIGYVQCYDRNGFPADASFSLMYSTVQ